MSYRSDSHQRDTGKKSVVVSGALNYHTAGDNLPLVDCSAGKLRHYIATASVTSSANINANQHCTLPLLSAFVLSTLFPQTLRVTPGHQRMGFGILGSTTSKYSRAKTLKKQRWGNIFTTEWKYDIILPGMLINEKNNELITFTDYAMRMMSIFDLQLHWTGANTR